jgi:ribosomal protein S18 acetylase RimI-like enzyme
MVKLEKMNQQEFDDFYSNVITEYANQKVEAGACPKEDALKLSEKSIARSLPNGLDTERQYLFSIKDVDKQMKVGYLWFGYYERFTRKEAFIHYLVIFEELRGKGYGTQSMEALEDELIKLEVEKVSLHVFSNNNEAISLYKKTGYFDTDLYMSKYIK